MMNSPVALDHAELDLLFTFFVEVVSVLANHFKSDLKSNQIT